MFKRSLQNTARIREQSINELMESAKKDFDNLNENETTSAEDEFAQLRISFSNLEQSYAKFKHTFEEYKGMLGMA